MMLSTIAILAQTASTTPPTTVDVSATYTILQPLLMAVATAAASVITAAAVQAVRWLQKKLNLTDAEAVNVGLQIDAQHRDALQTALTNAAGVALNRLGNNLVGQKIEVGNAAVASAVTQVIKAVPDAVDHFGLANKPDEIAQKIIGKMSQIAVTSGLPTK
jgi:hypothetical protein